jgi:DNA-binding CsgD family transcriptional regulator
MSAAKLLALTEQIYDAATGGTPWAAVGSGLASVLHARSASLMAGDLRGGSVELLAHNNIPHEAVAAYGARYRHVDLWTSRAATQVAPGGMPRVFISGHLVPESEFLRSEFWNDFGRHHGLRYVIGTVLPLGAAGSMPIGLHRPAGAAPFAEEEKRLLEAVLPHLRRALQLRHRLAGMPAAEAGPGIAALDALANGVVVTDAEGRVALANLAAEMMAARADAFRLAQAGGRETAGTLFQPCHRAEAEALLRLVRATALFGDAGGAMRLSRADGAPALAVLVMPLPARLAEAPLTLGGRVPGRALVLLRELGLAAAPRAAVLRDLFGLTAAEAEVARALAGGASKAAVAAQRGIAETTVRTQVRAVLAKTGAANLRDLERMLAGLSGL